MVSVWISKPAITNFAIWYRYQLPGRIVRFLQRKTLISLTAMPILKQSIIQTVTFVSQSVYCMTEFPPTIVVSVGSACWNIFWHNLVGKCHMYSVSWQNWMPWNLEFDFICHWKHTEIHSEQTFKLSKSDHEICEFLTIQYTGSWL